MQKLRVALFISISGIEIAEKLLQRPDVEIVAVNT